MRGVLPPFLRNEWNAAVDACVFRFIVCEKANFADEV